MYLPACLNENGRWQTTIIVIRTVITDCACDDHHQC